MRVGSSSLTDAILSVAESSLKLQALAKLYDGLIFVEESHPARGCPRHRWNLSCQFWITVKGGGGTERSTMQVRRSGYRDDAGTPYCPGLYKPYILPLCGKQQRVRGRLVMASHELANSSLGRMRTRNMLVARCVPVIGGTTESLQNPTVLRRSRAAAFVPQSPKLDLQALQFRDALFHVTDMGIQKRIDLTTVFARCGAKSEQNPDFIQCHVQGTATANERE